MGRIISRLKTDRHLSVDVWTGSPEGGLIHLGTSDDDGKPVASLTPAEAERLAIMLMAARTRLIGWRQALLDADVVLDVVDVAALEDMD